MTPTPYSLTNFEIQEYYQNEPRFNGVFSSDNLPNNSNNWVALYLNNKTIIYFDSFGVEHIPKEIIKFTDNEQSSSAKERNKNIITNIYRIQAYDSIMCGYFCIGFINFMFNGNGLTDYTSLFSTNDF